MDPLVLAPYFRPAIWGGRRLQGLLAKQLPEGGSWGESWEVSTHPSHDSLVAEGPLRGVPLGAPARLRCAELFGPGWVPGGGFPLLLKYLDARNWLSLQVHPDDLRSERLSAEPLGKTEAWVVLEAAPAARVYAGLLPGVGWRQLELALQAGRPEELLHGFDPRPGDCLFLPAGTVHAAVGVVLAEVQQCSDATLRLFDWGRVGCDGRPRPLHLPQALSAINWDAGPVAPVTGEKLSGLDGQADGERLVRCDYFVLDRYHVSGSLCAPYTGRLAVWMVVGGAAELCGGSFRRACKAGDTVLVPAVAPPMCWRAEGSAVLLAATLPSPGL